METQVRNNADLKAIDEQIKLHTLSISNLQKQRDELILKKIGKLLKETPEKRLYGFGKSYFCFENGKIIFVDFQGNHIVAERFIKNLIENYIPYTLYNEICNVKLD